MIITHFLSSILYLRFNYSYLIFSFKSLWNRQWEFSHCMQIEQTVADNFVRAICLVTQMAVMHLQGSMHSNS